MTIAIASTDSDITGESGIRSKKGRRQPSCLSSSFCSSLISQHYRRGHLAAPIHLHIPAM
jgi:hypothetical protein